MTDPKLSVLDLFFGPAEINGLTKRAKIKFLGADVEDDGDAIRVYTSGGGGSYATQSEWHVNPTTGSKSNDGTLLAPVRTIGDVLRRLGGLFKPPQQIDIYWHGATCTEDVTWSLALCAFDIVMHWDTYGAVTQTLPAGAGSAAAQSGTVVGGVQAAVDTILLTDANMAGGGWAPFVGPPYMVEITSGPAIGQRCMLLQDMTAGVVAASRFTGHVDASVNPISGSMLAPANGVSFSYKIIKLPAVTGVHTFVGGGGIGPDRAPPLNAVGNTIGFIRHVGGFISALSLPSWCVIDLCWIGQLNSDGRRNNFANGCGFATTNVITTGSSLLMTNGCMFDGCFFFVQAGGRFRTQGAPVLQNPVLVLCSGKVEIVSGFCLRNMAVPFSVYGGGHVSAGSSLYGTGSTSHHWECDAASGIAFARGFGFACGTTAAAQIKLIDGAGSLRSTVPVVDVATLAQVGAPIAVTYANLIAANPGGFGGSARDTLSGAYAATFRTQF